MQDQSCRCGDGTLGWIIVALISLFDASWLYLSGHSVMWAGIFAACKGAGTLICLAVILRALSGVRRYQVVTTRLRYAKVVDIAAWCALLLCFVSSTCVTSYLCVSINAPLIDSGLVAFDRSLGYDWLAAYEWVQRHPHVQKILQVAYASGHWQLLALPVLLGLFGRCEATSDFFFLLVLASTYLLLISTPFLAASAFIHFGVEDRSAIATVSDFALLRDGSLRVFDIANAQGLVSMPSFHTALAVLFTYSLRQLRLLFRVALPLNVVMILSTPTQGGHYLVDVITGLLLSALTILTLNAFSRRGANVRTCSANASAGVIGEASSERLH